MNAKIGNLGTSRLLLLWVGCWAAFLGLAWLVRRGSTHAFDASVQARVASHTPWRLERMGDQFTALGMAEVTLGLAVLLGLGALALGWYRLSLAVSLIWLSVPIELAFKWLLETTREDVPGMRTVAREALGIAASLDVQTLIDSPGSYPSGHVARTAYLAGLTLVLVLLLVPRLSRPARLAALPVALLALGVAAGMGITRITTGQHTPADVLGGYLLAAALLPPVPLVLGWRRRVQR